MIETGMFSLHPFPKAIIHIDANAFFTSVEQALRPELRGKPVVTGGERGIVACASYEAKARGVRRPMPLHEAKKICPDLIALPSDYESYSIFSERMFRIMRRFTPDVEEYSIDEAFADLGGLRRVYRTGFADIARRIKTEIQKELGLTVSVGLSASKSLAKIASARQKPDGFTVMPADELHRTLALIPLEAVCGFGPNTVALLEKQRITSVLGFVRMDLACVERLLGKIGVDLWHELRGKSVSPVESQKRRPQMSVQRQRSFAPTSDPAVVKSYLLRNAEDACETLRRHGLRAGTVSVALRGSDWKMSAAEIEFERPTASTLEASATIATLFEALREPGRIYRMSAVYLTKLSGGAETQLLMFEDPERVASMKRIDGAIDAANARYGRHTLRLGATTGESGPPREAAVTPSRRMLRLPGESTRQRLAIPLWRILV